MEHKYNFQVKKRAIEINFDYNSVIKLFITIISLVLNLIIIFKF